ARGERSRIAADAQHEPDAAAVAHALRRVILREGEMPVVATRIGHCELATVERFPAMPCADRRWRAMSPIGGKAEKMHAIGGLSLLTHFRRELSRAWAL